MIDIDYIVDIHGSKNPSLKHFIFRYRFDFNDIVAIDTKKAKLKHKRICRYRIDTVDGGND